MTILATAASLKSEQNNRKDELLQTRTVYIAGWVLGLFSSAGNLPETVVTAIPEQSQLEQEPQPAKPLETAFDSMVFVPIISNGANECSSIDEMSLEVVSGPVLTPALGSKFSAGRVPAIQAVWVVRNVGTCIWNNISLYSLNDGATISPKLNPQDQASELSTEQSLVGPGMLLEVALPFKPEDTDLVKNEWVFVINGFQLFAKPHVALDIKNWVTVEKSNLPGANQGGVNPAGTSNSGSSGDPGSSGFPVRNTEAPPQRP